MAPLGPAEPHPARAGRPAVADRGRSPPRGHGMNAPVTARGPLIVRLCNWVGEAVLSLPTLTLLAQQGYELHLVGKRWAQSLFEGHGWQVHEIGRASCRERV